MAVVRVTYYTDPACPWSWANEPELRRLEVQFGDRLSFTYVMAGLARNFERPLADLREWLDASAASSMPLDPRLWLEAPPASSYPASMAVKAAAEQGLEGPYLRRAREGFAFERRKLDNPDALVHLAHSVPGLDVERFRIDLSSNAVVELFGADLERSRALAAELDEERLPLPTAQFQGEDGAMAVISGRPTAGAYPAAAATVGAQPAADGPPGVEDALRRFGRLGTPEVAAACDLPGPRAPAELWRLAETWRARPEPILAGEMWSAA